jgi:hypothetical protein
MKRSSWAKLEEALRKGATFVSTPRPIRNDPTRSGLIDWLDSLPEPTTTDREYIGRGPNMSHYGKKMVPTIAMNKASDYCWEPPVYLPVVGTVHQHGNYFIADDRRDYVHVYHVKP